MEQTNIIARINDVAIVVLQKEKLVPVKPICEALGIDMESQRKKINEDDILGSTAVLSTVVAADGKEREMLCLPLEFVFGWLFSINHKNVKQEAQETVKKYKLQCYHALYRHFTEYSDFMEERQIRIEEELARVEQIRLQFNTAKQQLAEAQDELKKVRTYSFNEWKAKQIELSFG